MKIIFDTDYSTDCDDAGALAILHALADTGEAEILATGASTSRPTSPGAMDVVNTYYGRPGLPIAATKVGPAYHSSYTDHLYDNFPHDTPLSASVPDAIATYRQLLASQPDDSVVFVTVGYLTNMAELLKSPADAYSSRTGQELVAAKVREWVCMGGNFWTGSTDNVNFSRDAASAAYAIANFPNTLTFVPREVASVPSPLRAGEELNQTPLDNPVRIAYHKYFNRTTNIDRHCADLASVLYAVRGHHGYWDLHTTGSMTGVNSDGTFTWDEAGTRDHNYLVMKGGHGVYSNADEVEEVLRGLLKQPPGPVVAQWARFETEIPNTQSYADPYRDVTLNVIYTSPEGEDIPFWGYYDGGQTWKLRFMPHETGTWQYTATFSDGQPSKSGTFNCIASDTPATISAHSANPRWFGQQNGQPFLVRSFHAAGLFKFAIDDPTDPLDGEKRTAFLDWAQAQGYNTLSAHFFSTRDATDSGGPKIWPLNHQTYQKVEMILDDLSDREMVAYAFTGFFPNSGPYPSSSADRTLYIRYCLARFAPYWNIIMNVGGFEARDYLSDTEIRSLGAEINAANPFGHLNSAHQRDGDDIFRNDAWSSYVTLQHEITDLSLLGTYLRTNYVTGKPVYAQETLWMGNSLQPAWSLTDLRKQMWVHMMSAASYNAGDMNGNNESGFGGSLDLNDKIQARHDVPKLIWDFMASIPFQTLSPRQDLRNSGFMLANPGESYLCYLPAGGSVNIAVDGSGAPYALTWINARNPVLDQRAGGTTSNGQNLVAPDSQDWLAYLTRAGSGSGPEVHLTGNGNSIADGDTAPSTVNGTDLGSADVSGGSAVQVFTIHNTGSLALTVGVVTVSGTHAADFTVTAQPADTVAAGGSTTFSIRFDPAAIGLRSARLSFGNSDPDENPYDLSIRGIGYAGTGTIAFYHFTELPGSADPGNPILNYGSAGAALHLTETGGPDGRDNTGGGGYGAAGPEGWDQAFNILASGNGGYDSSTSGSTVGGGLQTAVAVPQSLLQGADGAFTYEAMIKLDGLTQEQTILAHDGQNGNRGFLFRVVDGTLSFYHGSGSITATIPTGGDHAFAAGSWFHVAVIYTGDEGVQDNLKFYWTSLGLSVNAANRIGSGTLNSDLAAEISNPLGLGTTTRSPYRFQIGYIDELRISQSARSEDELLVSLSPQEVWRLGKFGSKLGTGEAADDADPDSDGMINLDEYRAGTDPLSPASVLRVIRVEPTDADVQIDFSSVQGRRYSLERSGSLLPDSWDPVIEAIPGTGGTITLSDPDSSSETVVFYRIVVGP